MTPPWRSRGRGLRRVPVSGQTRRMKPAATSAVIRQWARENGIAVGVRGRLSPDVLAAYETARAGQTSQAAHAVEEALAAPAPDAGAYPGMRVAARPAVGAVESSRRIQARPDRVGARPAD